MNKSELIDAISNDALITKAQAKSAIESFTKNVTETLSSGGKISLIGWGTFSTTVRPAREGRNPQTGKTINIAEKTVVKFKPGTTLAESVNKKSN